MMELETEASFDGGSSSSSSSSSRIQNPHHHLHQQHHSHYNHRSQQLYASTTDDEDGSGMESDNGGRYSAPPSPLRSESGAAEGRPPRTVAMPKIIEPPRNLDLPPFLQTLHTFLNAQSGGCDDDMLLQEFEHNGEKGVGTGGELGSSSSLGGLGIGMGGGSGGGGSVGGGGEETASKYLMKRLMEAQNDEFRLNLDESKELARSRELGLFAGGQGGHRHHAIAHVL